MLDYHGFDACVVVAKVAFRLSVEGKARVGFRPVRASAEYDHGCLKFPHDWAAVKEGTDVGLVGMAHPVASRESKEAGRAYAWLQIGLMKKVIQIWGPRTYRLAWGEVSPSEPGPLEPTPLRYDLCYGGFDTDGATCEENPYGRGFGKDRTALVGKPAPQLEPVYDPLGRAPKDHPSHGVFAPIPAQWEPRNKLRGTHDFEWMRERNPVAPLDFDPHFENWSTPALYSKTPLRGDEPIEVAGVLPEGPWRFQLPHYPIEFASTIDGEKFTHPTHLDGILIDADERVVELAWRAVIRLPKKWEAVESIRARATIALPNEMLIDEPWPKSSEARI